jgi:hypothetical protein
MLPYYGSNEYNTVLHQALPNSQSNHSLCTVLQRAYQMHDCHIALHHLFHLSYILNDQNTLLLEHSYLFQQNEHF